MAANTGNPVGDPIIKGFGKSSSVRHKVADEPAEFSRFKDLARKLIAVPKREIDEKREKS